MSVKTYKQEVIQAAVDGLVEGGIPKDFAETLYPLFERIYECGYYESIRKLEEINYNKNI